MSLLPFLAIALGTGTAALLTRHRADVSGAIGIAGLLLAGGAALLSPALERLGGPLAAAAPAGSAAAAMAAGGVPASSFLAAGALTGVLLVLAGAGVGTVPRSLPGATLVTLGWAGLAVVVASPVASILLATAAGATSLLPVLDPRAASERGAVAGAIMLRATVAAGLVALGATALTGSRHVTAVPSEAVPGPALLGLAAAVAVRFGVIPLHRPAARLAGLAPTVVLPLVGAWAPVAFALVVVAGAEAAALSVERSVIMLVALAALGLATAALLLHDHVDHLLTYAIAADGAVALLALGSRDPAAATAALSGWLLVVAAGRSALVGWVVAAGGPAGTRRLGELRGWARRSPVLVLVLLAVAAASVGWPGSAAWAARVALVEGALDGLAGTVVLGAVVAGPAVMWLRLLAAGVQAPPPDAAMPGPEWRGRTRLATVAAVVLAALALATAVLAANGT